ncbi:hypothetical protein D0T25_09860 [Duganella sp. BJB488]|uniref:Uncharacterized protein n=1 Tax=Duganella vulcania TaxID=2692166 RepID=A0A845HIB3_9BURK|nr:MULTISPECIES: hypothetical protein [Duganella]MYN18520.1 hypothetical protein [Duganella vulcania]NVD74157.1 hypothetical protein [Duganella sp. BJB1802]RFP21557.1 hypothetical protein D0T26_09900 [Duganella sp. BJB489]RFP23350.1 hypothetical protein D0T25_09860 [Duganella sp. BJB488]RFP38516.1 hypothetical protein D0T24_02705 [Duganella sp. BJB480]
MQIIQFTEAVSLKTVKPAKTIFLNNTGQDLVLKFVTAPDMLLAAYTISNGVSAAIDSIRLGTVDYYSGHSHNFAIAAGSTAVLNVTNNVLNMVISP